MCSQHGGHEHVQRRGNGSAPGHQEEIGSDVGHEGSEVRGVRLNWNLAHITHPHTRHPSLITMATKRTFRRFVTLSLPHRTPISHLLTPSQPHNNPPLLSRLLPLTSRLLNRGPRLFLLPEVRVQWVWLHTGRGVATQDLLSWWRDTISDSVYVCFIHSLAFEIINTTSHYQQYCFNYTYTLFL